MDGWIKLHRSIKDHWIWSDPVKLKWWLDILLTVNHAATKVNIGFQLYECGRGQSIQSIGSWASQWGTTKDTARNFLTLLEKDGMILHEGLGKTTRLTVCNYESYQDDLHDSPPMNLQESHRSPTDEPPISHTNKKDKNDKNIFNKEINKENDSDLFPGSTLDSDLSTEQKARIAKSKKIKYADDVTLTSEEYTKLCEAYSEPDAKGMIDLLSNYKGQNGKRYKSDYKAILNWVVKAYYERQQQNRTVNNSINTESQTAQPAEPEPKPGKNYSERF